MKIALIKNGGISIPPRGWGAIETVTWEYKKGLEKAGHQVDITWLDEVRDDHDIVHVHSCNLALLAKERGLRYVFSFHDHHPISNGRDGIQFRDHKTAFEGSLFSLCHAEWIVDYFGCEKLHFLSHGVDTSFFKMEGNKPAIPKILCLASNGSNGDDTIDRKGFIHAVEAARILGLEITVAGPSNVRVFFEAYPELEYHKLKKITSNPNKKTVRELFNAHSVFLHPSHLETGHPNLTILESVSCGTPVVGTYDGLQKIESLYRIEKPCTKLVVKGIVEVLKNYEYYRKKTQEDAKRFDWDILTSQLDEMYIKYVANT